MEEIKCAIYTRKSTDEGLEKEFNTLEAQREAGENYVKSQKHQGWILVDEHYDDGGFSGGNMKRPALQRLFKDIELGKINMIVVYKIDRLTRSLVDFSKMVDIFDKYHCSFVSVTQNFNTSDSMGRLTLNMLLSFAQFEREIGSERVRDKTAASRKKGMWTGGTVPFGYRSVNKKLEIEPNEAEAVKFMFEMYIKYKSAMAVCKLLTEKGYRAFRRDAVLRMLKNPIYEGKIKYKHELYDGQHQAIIRQKTFEAVQYILLNKDKRERTCLFNRNEVGILRGLLICGCCHAPMTPASCQSHGVRRYYYTSTKAKYYGYHHCSNGAVPVALMDECMTKIVTPLISDINVLNGLINKICPDKSAEIYKVMRNPEKIIERMTERDKLQLMKLLIKKIIVNYDTIEINWSDLALSLLPAYLRARTQNQITIIDYPFKRNKGALTLSLPEEVAPNINYNAELITALCKAFKYQKIMNKEKQSIIELAANENIDSGYLGRLIRLTCLAPDIIKRILEGTQPTTIYLKRLLREDIPPIWQDQRIKYGFVK
jgi:DNA invertase Pin-like site-specific DNA recombinase